MRIMENISEIKKNKVGRPKRYAQLEHGLRVIYPELQTQRSINNMVYYTHAFGLLIKSNEYSYLVDAEKQLVKRATIMTELGRVAMRYSNGDELALELARDICRHKLNTQKAIDFINGFRNANGDNVGKDKTRGTMKKILRLILNARLNLRQGTALMEALAKINIGDFTKVE